MEVPIQDLLSPTPPTRTSPRNKRPISSHPHTSRIDADSEVASSMRASVLSRNFVSRHGATKDKDSARVHSSASSIRSARSTLSTSSAASDTTIGRSSRADTVNTAMSPARQIVQDIRARDAAAKERPDSKLTPAMPPTDSRDPSPSPQSPSPLSPQADDHKSVSEFETRVALEDDHDKASIAASDTPAESVPEKVVITRKSLANISSRSPGSPSLPSRNIKATPPASTRSRPASTAVRKSIASRQSGVNSRSVSRSSTTTTTASTLSRVSTTRSSTAMSTATTTISSVSRPASAVSTASSSTTSSAHPHRVSTVTVESAGTYKTASSKFSPTSPQPRSRKSSAASASSVRTAGQLPTSGRARKVSGASVHSINSTASSSIYGTAKSSVSRTQRQAPPPVPPIDPTKLSPSVVKTRSTASFRSVKSTASIKKTPTAPRVDRTIIVKKSPQISASSMPSAESRTSLPLPAEENKENEGNSEEKEEEEEIKNINISSGMTVKPGMLVESDMNANMEHKKSGSMNSTGSAATIRKKKSNETMIVSGAASTHASSCSQSSGGSEGDDGGDKSKSLEGFEPQPPLPVVQSELDKQQQQQQQQQQSSLNVTPQARGVTLKIGIPCIVSSKRKRFKAYARYIGEVQGEHGPWVGVEVPIPLGESWADRDLDCSWQGTQWNDGTWGGIRYFEIGNGTMTGGHRGGGVGGGGGGADWEYSYDDKVTRRKGANSISTSTWSSSSFLKERGMVGVGVVDKVKRVRSASPTTVSDASGLESRGLFVRPQQILYVVDAVEDL